MNALHDQLIALQKQVASLPGNGSHPFCRPDVHEAILAMGARSVSHEEPSILSEKLASLLAEQRGSTLTAARGWISDNLCSLAGPGGLVGFDGERYSVTEVCRYVLQLYVDYPDSDPDDVVQPVAEEELARKLDDKHLRRDITWTYLHAIPRRRPAGKARRNALSPELMLVFFFLAEEAIRRKYAWLTISDLRKSIPFEKEMHNFIARFHQTQKKVLSEMNLIEMKGRHEFRGSRQAVAHAERMAAAWTYDQGPGIAGEAK